MSTSDFFKKQTLSSKVKANIVAEYFPSYALIISNKHNPKRIGYYDLFAGPGKYEDGNPSTPILLARNCVQNDFLRNKVWMIFNDKDYCEVLKQNFLAEFPEGTFTHKVHFRDQEVGTCQGINEFLLRNTMENGKNECPAVLFIDPFGYKNINTKIIATFLQYWGNEAFIFINTKRINPAFENDKFDLILQELFPCSHRQTKEALRQITQTSERLQYIIDSLGQEYQRLISPSGNVQVYYTAFKFQEEEISTTSHYILHITKSHRGFDLIKQIYNDFANVGTIFDEKNTYTFDPKFSNSSVLDPFDSKSENIDNLKEKLYLDFQNKKMAASEIFDSHQINNLYSRSHYTEALRRLVKEGRANAEYIDGKHHKVSVLLSNQCIVTIYGRK